MTKGSHGDGGSYITTLLRDMKIAAVIRRTPPWKAAPPKFHLVYLAGGLIINFFGVASSSCVTCDRKPVGAGKISGERRFTRKRFEDGIEGFP
jgi:hypothetical protein